MCSDSLTLTLKYSGNTYSNLRYTAFMCGIAGLVHIDGSAIDRGQLDRLTDAIAHRGPDGRGIFIDNNVGLGHRRLSIIDLTTAASQPMFSEDKNVALIFNGEIYNFQEER